jgi:DNA-binding NtrC family response regulator
VAATHDLTRPEYKDKFSRDLLYHLMVNSIRMPPLRDRRGDLALLAEALLKEESKRVGREINGLSDDFMESLKDYSFPTNVQELRAIIAGAIANTEGDVVTAESLPLYIQDIVKMERAGVEVGFTPRRLDDVMREHVRKTLEHFDQRKDIAAEQLGVTPEELDRLLGEAE